MDIYCQQCEEPYETHYVQHEMNDQERRDFLNGKHCPCCEGKETNKLQSKRIVAQNIAMDIMGDDLDGVASAMDDFDYMGLFRE